MRIALVCTPEAGSRKGGEELSTRLRREGAEVTVYRRERLEEVAGTDPDRLVVAGGDGSVGAAAAMAGWLGTPLAVLPTGTANNFAAAHGVPRSLDAACRLAVHGQRTAPVELGYAGGVPFVNLASAGLAPVAAERAERLKRVLGPTAYAIGAAAAAATTPPLECSIATNGASAFEGRAWQVMIASSGAFGPGVQIEGTDPGDGALDLVVIAAGPRAELLRRAWWLRQGRIASQPGAVHARADEFHIGVAEDARFNVDGEVLALGPTRFTGQRGAFKLVVG
jgi:diacylglycerol kinase (ATP)